MFDRSEIQHGNLSILDFLFDVPILVFVFVWSKVVAISMAP
jgi:hypothetical protein